MTQMNDTKEQLQRARSQFPPPEGVMDSLIRRRDRKRRNQRIAAGVVGIAVFVAAVWVVTSGPFDQTQTEVVPGGAGTGPAVTGPAVTGPVVTGPVVAGPAVTGPAQPTAIGTVTSAGGGCTLEIDAGPILPGAGRLTVVNETDRRVAFELYRLASDASFAQLQAVVAEGDPLVHHPSGAFFLLMQREVEPGASSAITDNFTTGHAFAVACLGHSRYLPEGADLPFGEWVQWQAWGSYLPFAVVGPIVVP